jgi:ubiquinone/menaquinone biosynthesis C-methylase UbiE
VSTTSSHKENVKQHYRALADCYNARANQTCERTYRSLVRQFLGGQARILELGAGSSDLLNQVCTTFAVATDLSLDMLRSRIPDKRIQCLVTAGERLPFQDATFDGLFSIIVLEHVSDVPTVLQESSRVLQPGGRFMAITPNGNWEKLLDLAERWSLKIPEGPHLFLTTRGLRQAVDRHFEVLAHRTFLIVPAGPARLARLFDQLTFCSALGWGFFQYIVARKKSE